jgi:hypothetical protein
VRGYGKPFYGALHRERVCATDVERVYLFRRSQAYAPGERAGLNGRFQTKSLVEGKGF